MKNSIIYLVLAVAFIFAGCSNNNNDELLKALNDLDSGLKVQELNIDTVNADKQEEEVKEIIKETNPANLTLDTLLLLFNSATELEGYFGKENVKKSTGYFPEGMGEYNNVLLFPDTKNEVEFVWDNDKDYSEIAYIVISKDNSEWKTKEGITVGTTLKELEKLNKNSFTFLGFDWDYSGMTNFNGGYLNERKISANLEYPGGKIPDNEIDLWLGDVTIDSKSESAQKVNPVVRTLTISKEK